MLARVFVRARVHACVSACVRAWACAGVRGRACVRVCVCAGDRVGGAETETQRETETD